MKLFLVSNVADSSLSSFSILQSDQAPVVALALDVVGPDASLELSRDAPPVVCAHEELWLDFALALEGVTGVVHDGRLT